MKNGQQPYSSRLFTVRLWLEELGNGQYEWRGKLHDVTSGEVRYFREWQTFTSMLRELFPPPEGKQQTMLRGRKEEPMILVVGATGDLGGAVTQMLLKQGKAVRILARPQSNYQALSNAGAQVVLGDLKDRASLDSACQGIETIITTANSARRGGEDTPQSVDLEGNQHLIDAAKAAGVKQFIFISANIADPNSPIPFLRAKGKTEEYLRESGIPYTIIAPDIYMEVWIALVVGQPALNGQPVTLVGEGRRKHSSISAGDVAQFIVASIGNPTAINQKLLLGGPEPLSFRDAIVVYERVLGHEIPVRSVALGESVPGLPDFMAQMLAGFDMYDSPIDMSKTADAFGIQLTSLEQVVRQTSINTK